MDKAYYVSIFQVETFIEVEFVMERFIDYVKKNGIIVWGRGQEARKFLQAWEKTCGVYYSFYGEKLAEIKCFWDTNLRDVHAEDDIKIQTPLTTASNTAFCVIAINNYKPIIKELSAAGWNDTCYLYWQEFLLKIKSEFIMNYHDKSAKFLNDAKNNICLYNRIEKWINEGCKKNIYEQIKNEFSLERTIAHLSFLCSYEVGSILDFFENYSLNNEYAHIKTIGIYDERFHNGGGQRFLSIIIPIYLSQGYKVVLFTDEYVPEKEYKLPIEVERVVFKNSYWSDLEKRLEELNTAINKFDINIMCYHNRVDCEEFFYEMIYLHQMGIPVLAELHLMFAMTLDHGKCLLPYLPRIFKMADKIVVLSRINEKFWNALGCNSVYIPNPVEDANNVWGKELDFSKRAGNNIVWIGRIAQSGKRIFDAIEIMNIVHKVNDKARLKIIGDVNSSTVKNKLNELICKYNLENVIELCGYQSDVYPFYEEADCMLMTSEMEGFPLVLMESKLYGVPTVMYELPYLELVQDERGIISVRQKNIKDAAKEILNMLSNEKMRIKKSEEAKESLRKFIDYDIAGAWNKVFREIEDSKLSTKEADEFYKEIIKILFNSMCTKVYE